MSESRVTYEQLLSFAAGDLGGERAERIEAHLVVHPDAAATVARYRMTRSTLRADDGVDPPVSAVARARAIYAPPRGAARSPSPAPSLGEAVAHLVASLVYDSRAEPALAGVRGAVTGFQLEYDLPETGARLELRADAEEEGDGVNGRRWRLVGQVTSHKSPAVRVAVCRAGSLTPILETDADQRGVFVLKIDPGTYDLHVHLPGGVTVVPDIRMT